MQYSVIKPANYGDSRILIYEDSVRLPATENTLSGKQIISCYRRSASSPKSGIKRQSSSHGADQNKQGPIYVAEIFMLERN